MQTINGRVRLPDGTFATYSYEGTVLTIVHAERAPDGRSVDLTETDGRAVPGSEIHASCMKGCYGLKQGDFAAYLECCAFCLIA